MYTTGTNSYFFYKPLSLVALCLMVTSAVSVAKYVSTSRIDRLSVPHNDY